MKRHVSVGAGLAVAVAAAVLPALPSSSTGPALGVAAATSSTVKVKLKKSWKVRRSSQLKLADGPMTCSVVRLLGKKRTGATGARIRCSLPGASGARTVRLRVSVKGRKGARVKVPVLFQLAKDSPDPTPTSPSPSQSPSTPSAGPVSFRIVGFTESLLSQTEYGLTTRTDTWKGTPGEPADVESCEWVGDPDCVGSSFAMQTQVTTVSDGHVAKDGCTFTYPTYTQDNRGRLSLYLDPSGGGPAVVKDSVPLANVGDVNVNACGAMSITDDAPQVKTTVDRGVALSGQPFEVLLVLNDRPPATAYSATTNIYRNWSLKATLQAVKPDGSPYP